MPVVFEHFAFWKKRCLRLTCILPSSALQSAVLDWDMNPGSLLQSSLFNTHVGLWGPVSALCDLGPVPFPSLSQTFSVWAVGELNSALILYPPKGAADTKLSLSLCLFPQAGRVAGTGLLHWVVGFVWQRRPPILLEQVGGALVWLTLGNSEISSLRQTRTGWPLGVTLSLSQSCLRGKGFRLPFCYCSRLRLNWLRCIFFF